MKIVSLYLFVTLFAVGFLHAQLPGKAPENPNALNDLVAGSHWAWYEGDFSRYTKFKMPQWIEFYKDGTARVPWRGHPQYWSLEGNVLVVSDSGIGGDKHSFNMNLDSKSGSAANNNLHIRYEKRATKPALWK